MIDKVAKAKAATKYYNDRNPAFLNGEVIRPDEISDCGNFVTLTIDPSLGKPIEYSGIKVNYKIEGDVVTVETEPTKTTSCGRATIKGLPIPELKD